MSILARKFDEDAGHVPTKRTSGKYKLGKADLNKSTKVSDIDWSEERNSDDSWDVDQEVGPEHVRERQETLYYDELLENGKLVRQQSDELRRQIDVVLIDKKEAAYSNLTEGSHLKTLKCEDLKVYLSTISDGIKDRKGKALNLAVEAVQINKGISGDKVKRVDLHMFEINANAQRGEVAIDTIHSVFDKKDIEKTLVEGNKGVNDETKVHLDFEKMKIDVEQMGNGGHKCFVLRGKMLIEISDTNNFWDKVESPLKAGDLVVVLSSQMVAALDKTSFAGVVTYDGDDAYLRASKIRNLVDEARDRKTGQFNAEDFHENMTFWYNTQKRPENALNTASFAVIEISSGI